MSGRIKGTTARDYSTAPRHGIPSNAAASTTSSSSNSARDTQSTALRRSDRNVLRTAFNGLAHAFGFRQHRTRDRIPNDNHKAEHQPDDAEHVNGEVGQSDTSTSAMSVLCDEWYLRRIFGTWSRRPLTRADYRQAWVSNDSYDGLSRSCKSVRQAMKPVLSGLFQYNHYPMTQPYWSGPKGCLGYAGRSSDTIAFGKWITKQLLPPKLENYSSILVDVMRDGFLGQYVRPDIENAFFDYMKHRKYQMAQRMLSSGLLSPTEFAHGVRPMFWLAQKADARNIITFLESLPEGQETANILNLNDGMHPPVRLLDYAIRRRQPAVIELLNKLGAVRAGVAVQTQSPPRLLYANTSSHSRSSRTSSEYESESVRSQSRPHAARESEFETSYSA
jgi:hypothetical protein